MDEESKDLTCFLIPQGRFRYTRTAMGMRDSSDHFCARTDEIVRDIPGVQKMVDDALGASSGFPDLLTNLYTLFLQFKKNNVVISVDKFLISNKVPFGGIMLDASEGDLKIYPDPSRIIALKNLQTPKNRKELLSFLGTLTTFQKWTPSLSFVTKHLRLLSSKNSIFKWTDEHQIEFNKAKSIISDLKRLSPFDILKDTELIVDGSGVTLWYNHGWMGVRISSNVILWG